MEKQHQALRESISKFLHHESLYEMIPVSGIVLVLDKNLTLYDVIDLSLSHKQESGILWTQRRKPTWAQLTHAIS